MDDRCTSAWDLALDSAVWGFRFGFVGWGLTVGVIAWGVYAASAVRVLRIREFLRLLAQGHPPAGMNSANTRQLRVLRALSLAWLLFNGASIVVMVVPFLVAKVICG